MPTIEDIMPLLDQLAQLQSTAKAASEQQALVRASMPSVGRYFGNARPGTPENIQYIEGMERGRAMEAGIADQFASVIANTEPAARALVRLYEPPRDDAAVPAAAQGSIPIAEATRDSSDWTGHQDLSGRIAAIKLSAPAARAAIAATLAELETARVNNPALADHLRVLDGQIVKLSDAAEHSRDLAADLEEVGSSLKNLLSQSNDAFRYVSDNPSLLAVIFAVTMLMSGSMVAVGVLATVFNSFKKAK